MLARTIAFASTAALFTRVWICSAQPGRQCVRGVHGRAGVCLNCAFWGPEHTCSGGRAGTCAGGVHVQLRMVALERATQQL